MYRVYLTGGDLANWALDTELRLARKALESFAEIVEHPRQADFVHTVDVVQTVKEIQRRQPITHVPIVGPINNHPTRLAEWPGFIETARHFVELVPQSEIAAQEMQRLGLPYPGKASLSADFEPYHPIPSDDPQLAEYRRRIGLPRDAYVIGLLQRDSDGKNLHRIKIQKGADIFAGLMLMLKHKAPAGRFHVLLGGPRRHWLRNALDAHEIPYTFVGELIEGDDYPQNILDTEQMCLLYNLIDLYVIPTRWEGAPRQVFDVICCKRKIISTPVGIVPEVLDPQCLFEDLDTASEMILRDMNTGYLSEFIEPNWDLVCRKHRPEVAAKAWKTIYDSIAARYGLSRPSTAIRLRRRCAWGRLWGQWFVTRSRARLRGPFARTRDLAFGTTSLLNDEAIRARFLTALIATLERQGVTVSRSTGDPVDALLLSGMQAEPGRVQAQDARSVVHCLDEPTTGMLVDAPESSRAHFSALQEVADVTVLASEMCLEDLARADLAPKDPIIIRVPPNPSVFHVADGAAHGSGDRAPVLLVTTAPTETNRRFVRAFCSGPLAGKYEPTLMAEETFDVNGLPVAISPSPEQRANLARSAAVAVALPPVRDSYTMLEILACGLPVALHGELHRLQNVVGMAGLRFDDEAELLSVLASLCRHSEAFRMTACLPYPDDAVEALKEAVRRATYACRP